MNYYSENERKILLKLAFATIDYGLENHSLLSVNLTDFPDKLLERRACFVTLHLNSQLRGCIGSLVIQRSLTEDVIHNAYAAAFQDPRFPALTKAEFAQIEMHISVLSETEVINFETEDDLLKQIRPHIDGLILSDGMHRGTFLPSVWESLREPKEFLTHLKMKAGLSPNYWSESIVVERYTTESFSN